MWASPQAAAASPELDARFFQQIEKRLAPAREAALQDYLNGERPQAVARLVDSIDAADWRALFVLANSTWTLEPAESFRWQQRAYALSGGDLHVLIELALHYTRNAQCGQAIAAWKTIDDAGMLGGAMPMLAGYCHLQLGQDEQAYAMFDRSQSRPGALEGLLEELWGRTPAIVVHADRLEAFNASGDPTELDAALTNAIRLDVGAERGRALIVIAEAATRAGNSPLAAPLTCLRPAFEAESRVASMSADASASAIDANALIASINAKKALPQSWKQHMTACRMLVAPHPLPESPALTKFLVTNALNMDIATDQELLAAHHAALNQRARQPHGDRDALEVLAALQEKVGDPALKDTDQLGWERYGLAAFAVSRVQRESNQGALSDDGKRLLARAHTQFPHDAGVLAQWLAYATPDKAAARDGWRELALLQFHTPSITREQLHVQPLAATLYRALQQYRNAPGLP